MKWQRCKLDYPNAHKVVSNIVPSASQESKNKQSFTLADPVFVNIFLGLMFSIELVKEIHFQTKSSDVHATL